MRKLEKRNVPFLAADGNLTKRHARASYPFIYPVSFFRRFFLNAVLFFLCLRNLRFGERPVRISQQCSMTGKKRSDDARGSQCKRLLFGARPGVGSKPRAVSLCFFVCMHVGIVFCYMVVAKKTFCQTWWQSRARSLEWPHFPRR